MIFSLPLPWVAVVATVASANPAPIKAIHVIEPAIQIVDDWKLDSPSPAAANTLPTRPAGELMVRRNGLVARTDSKDISLAQTLENELLFDSSSLPFFPGPTVTVVCTKCCSKGSIKATFPSDLTDIVNPKFRVDLLGIEAHVELDVIVAAASSFSIPLLKLPPGTTNIEIPGFKAGLFVDLALVFELSAQVDLHGGFYLKIPDGSFFEIDITEAGAHSENFDGIISKSLPITVNNGTQIEAKVDLQLKTSFGITAGTDAIPNGIPVLGDIPDFGGGAEVGAYINIVELIANVAPAATCALEAREEVNFNLGAFAKFGVSFQDDFFGVQPTASTTLFSLPIGTQCIIPRGVPFPTRSVRPASVVSCVAGPPPPVANRTAIAPVPIRTLTPLIVPVTVPVAVSTVRRITTECDDDLAPVATKVMTATRIVYKRQAPPSQPQVTSLTATACVSNLANCPQSLQTTFVFPQTICPPPPIATGNCFGLAASNATRLRPTSVVGRPPSEAAPSPPATDAAPPGSAAASPPSPAVVTPSPSGGLPDGGALAGPADGAAFIPINGTATTTERTTVPTGAASKPRGGRVAAICVPLFIISVII